MKTKLLIVVSLCVLALVSASTASAQVSCSGLPAFATCTAYANGASVTFNGSKYTTIAPIPNNRDCPPNSPYNPSTDNWWVNNGTCSGATATATRAATATATATTGATATRTNTATATARTGATATRTPTTAATATRTNTATATPTTGTGTNLSYTSAYWTQNNDPCTNNGPAGSGEEWVAGGACAGQPAWVATTAYNGGSVVCRVCGGGTNPTATATTVGATPTRTPTGGATATNTTVPRATPTGPGGGSRHRAGYFEQWGIYARGCQLGNGCVPLGIETLYYAFSNPAGGSGKALFGVNQLGVGDQWADYGQPQNGEAYNAKLKGNFNSLKLKRPASGSIHNFLSVGGWTWSDGFYAARGDSGTAMVASYVDVVVKGNLPVASDQTGGAGVATGIFDGVDLDWEYPGVCGNNPSCGAQASDKGLYTSIVQKFRAALPSNMKITAAVAAGSDKLPYYDIPALCASLDEVHIMTYDYFGGWKATGPTAPHSPLFAFTGQSGLAAPENDYYTDKSVQLWVNGGCSRSKIMIGVGSYGRGWAGSFSGNGLNQPATGPASGTYEAGIEDYDVLISRCPANNASAYPSTTTAGTAWCSTSSLWYSYDTPATVAGKVSYSVAQGLRGTFLWAFSGDNGQIYNAMQ